MLHINSSSTQDIIKPRLHHQRTDLTVDNLPTSVLLTTTPPTPPCSPLLSRNNSSTSRTSPSMSTPRSDSNGIVSVNNDRRIGSSKRSGSRPSSSSSSNSSRYSGRSSSQCSDRSLRFNNVVVVGYTWAPAEYDRTSIEVSPLKAEDINEIRQMRTEMWEQHPSNRKQATNDHERVREGLSNMGIVDGQNNHVIVTGTHAGIPPASCRHGQFFNSCEDCHMASFCAM